MITFKTLHSTTLWSPKQRPKKDVTPCGADSTATIHTSKGLPCPTHQCRGVRATSLCRHMTETYCNDRLIPFWIKHRQRYWDIEDRFFGSSGMASSLLPSLTVIGARKKTGHPAWEQLGRPCRLPLFFHFLQLFTCLFRATSLAALLTAALACRLLRSFHWSNSTSVCGASTAIPPAPSHLSAHTF